MVASWPALLGFAAALLCLIAALYGASRRALGSRSVDWPLLVFVALAGGAIVTGWLATGLATTGWYSLLLLALVMALVAALPTAYWWRLRGAVQGALAAPGWQEAALGGLLVVAALLYLRPHEYVLGGNDAGSYVNTASQIARTGSIVAEDAWTAFLGEYREVTLREQPAHWLPRYLQFVGWYIDDANPARTVPQFFPFHPALLAVGASLAGPAGALYVTPLWGVLDIAALYFLARRLFGKNVALAASLFLTVTTTQIFFARYPTAEPLTMLLVFTALLAFQVIWDEPNAPWPWGLLGGGALGAALLTRIDLPLVLALFVLGLLVRWWQRRWSRAWSAFAAVLALALLHLAWVVWQINWPYFYNTYTAVGSLLRADRAAVAGVGLALALLLLAALAIATVRRPAGLVNRAARFLTHPALRWSLAAAIVLLSLYAYFLRPVLEPPREYLVWPENTTGIALNGQNWVRMGWYLTPLGLVLATVGLALIFVRDNLPRLALVLSVGVLTTLQYLYNILNAHYHIYAMRRYVPIVIPMLLLFAAVGALAFPMLRRRWITYTVRGLCVAGLAAGLFYQARFVLQQRDFAGALAQVAAFEARLAPDALVLLPGPMDSNFADTFGVPLQKIFGRDVLTLRSDAPAGGAFVADLLARAQAAGRPVQLIARGVLPATVRENLTLEPADSFTFTGEMLMNTYDGFPSAVQEIRHGLEIYDVAPAGAPAAASTGEVVVDIGAFDAPYLGAGFYAVEVMPDAPTMRWTGAAADLVAPVGLAAGLPSSATVEIQVRAMIYRPEGVAPAPVKVSLDGQEIGEFTPRDAWETYTFAVSAAHLRVGPAATIALQTIPFNPAALHISTDDRDLGVLLDWVKIAVPQEAAAP